MQKLIHVLRNTFSLLKFHVKKGRTYSLPVSLLFSSHFTTDNLCISRLSPKKNRFLISQKLRELTLFFARRFGRALTTTRRNFNKREKVSETIKNSL